MKSKLKSLQPLIPAIDVDAASAFYQEQLGFKHIWNDGTPASMAIIHRDDIEIFLTVDRNPEHALASSIRISVENIDSLYAEYEAKKVIHPNGELCVKPWGLKEFIIKDLNGVCIAFHETPKTPREIVINPNKDLETERLCLHPLKLQHFKEMHEIYSNPKAMLHWHTLPHTSFVETESLLNDYCATNSSWVLELKNSKKIIGLINCFSVEDSKPTGMGYIISPEFQQSGLATEASKKVMEHLFKEWNTPYLELWIFNDNTPSIRLAQKLGFKLENSFERAGADGTTLKKTGSYWLRQSQWWSKSQKNA